MADIVYCYNDEVYFNLTNKCPCNCTFCIRNMLKFAQDCKKYTENVKFTVVDCIGEENVEKSRKVAEKLGIPLRVREYTAE